MALTLCTDWWVSLVSCSATMCAFPGGEGLSSLVGHLVEVVGDEVDVLGIIAVLGVCGLFEEVGDVGNRSL